MSDRDELVFGYCKKVLAADSFLRHSPQSPEFLRTVEGQLNGFVGDLPTLARQSKGLIGDDLYEVFLSFHGALVELLKARAEGSPALAKSAESVLDRTRHELNSHISDDVLAAILAWEQGSAA